MRDAGGIAVRTFGTGPSPALMLHCGLGQSGMLKRMAAPLGTRLTITAPDLPGHGQSADFPPDRDVMAAARDAMHPFLQPGAHLVGHSFGACVALWLALENPEKVASLTLIEPVLFAAAPDGPVRDAQRGIEDEIEALTVQGDRTGATRLFNRIWGGGARWDSLMPDTRARMVAQMPFILATEPALWRDVHGLLAPGRLEALRLPVLLLRGSQTVPIVAELHRGLAARLPDVTETVIEGADHMLPVTHPAPCASAIAAHLDRVG
ncbi:alpha/beta fold hydrolase [Pseudoponticoccus marisrubri]|uniref:AB hydrolase-1 domain-containing protein n=1 Tax=Pseudoponticoccus marisrubri TaxID=1685382 RepID=A0A0W7WGZ4_9RHOB|nr:alpha/beta hydrolase [Pseudoponticoccus marisrubri]KUF09736.1 hypothetical protein AVJ23_16420 [Pseudoponticoccus marisrubri]